MLNNHSRALFVVIALVAAVVCATPGAAAAEGSGDGDDDENAKGEKFCKRVAGLNACVAVLHGSCTLWISAGIGGCIIGDGKEIDAHATSSAA